MPLHSACLPTESQISLSDAWYTLLPHCPLTGELILPTPLLNGSILMGTTAFSRGSTQSTAVGVQGQRRAHSQMSLGMRYASEIRLPPDIQRLNPPPTPTNGLAQYCGCFHLEVFPPCCVTSAFTVDSLLPLSSVPLWHAGLQRTVFQINELHFTLVHLENCLWRFSLPLRQ